MSTLQLYASKDNPTETRKGDQKMLCSSCLHKIQSDDRSECIVILTLGVDLDGTDVQIWA